MSSSVFLCSYSAWDMMTIHPHTLKTALWHPHMLEKNPGRLGGHQQLYKACHQNQWISVKKNPWVHPPIWSILVVPPADKHQLLDANKKINKSYHKLSWKNVKPNMAGPPENGANGKRRFRAWKPINCKGSSHWFRVNFPPTCRNSYIVLFYDFGRPQKSCPRNFAGRGAWFFLGGRTRGV